MERTMTSDKRPNELTALEALEQINGGSLTSEELVECPLLAISGPFATP